ncbi:hypothetical protein J1N35_022608 [Gossypium stocksii]|uniref:Uncharacterized protein n=1 Tax=Gossypium stocksii TaxID=47602 RepID=A0A9D3VI37_9ROSI|nr:hypothetical protein J1N35_022608 [Gossypium stocksii]
MVLAISGFPIFYYFAAVPNTAKVFRTFQEVVQETEVKVSPPTSGGDNLELGTKALTYLVREVLEELFEARVKEMGEMLRSRSSDCKKKRDHGSLELESSFCETC